MIDHSDPYLDIFVGLTFILTNSVLTLSVNLRETQLLFDTLLYCWFKRKDFQWYTCEKYDCDLARILRMNGIYNQAWSVKEGDCPRR